MFSLFAIIIALFILAGCKKEMDTITDSEQIEGEKQKGINIVWLDELEKYKEQGKQITLLSASDGYVLFQANTAKERDWKSSGFKQTYGLLDTNGGIVFEPDYFLLKMVGGGKFLVSESKDSYPFLIDEDSNELIKYNSFITKLANGFGVTNSASSDWLEGYYSKRKYGIIDITSGKEMLPQKYDECVLGDKVIAAGTKTGDVWEWEIYDYDLEQIAIVEGIGEISSIAVIKNKIVFGSYDSEYRRAYGVMDMSGNIEIKPSHSHAEEAKKLLAEYGINVEHSNLQSYNGLTAINNPEDTVAELKKVWKELTENMKGYGVKASDLYRNQDIKIVDDNSNVIMDFSNESGLIKVEGTECGLWCLVYANDEELFCKLMDSEGNIFEEDYSFIYTAEVVDGYVLCETKTGEKLFVNEKNEKIKLDYELPTETGDTAIGITCVYDRKADMIGIVHIVEE